MITIEKAYEKMAALMKAEMDMWEKMYGSKGIYKNTDDKDIPISIRDERKKLERETENFATILYSNPLFAEMMIPWMVDIEGGDLPKDFVQKVIESENFDITTQLAKTHTPIQMVKIAIECWGFKITDSGGGCGGWHLGVPCTDIQSKTLCNLMYARFSRWIDEEVIAVKKKWWKPRLPGLYNWDDVITYYRHQAGELQGD